MKIEIPLQLGQPALQFRSFKSARVWAEGELEFWRGLEQIRRKSPDSQFLRWDHIENSLQKVVAVATEKPSTSEQRADRLTRLDNAIRSAVERLVLMSNDPRARFLKQLQMAGEDDGKIGATLIAFMEPQRLNVHLTNRQHAATASSAIAHRALFFQQNSEEKISAFRSSLEHYEQLAREAVTDSQALVDETTDKLGQTVRVAAEAVRRARKARRAAAGQFEARLDAVRAEFRTEIALRSPTEYWEGKAQDHDKVARVYRNTFVWILGLGLIAMAVIAVAWLLPELGKSEEEFWPLVIFSFLVAAWAWPLRLTSRLYLSHRHLKEDAAERGVIARTFLALNEEVELEAEDRQLLLAALFRQSSGGLVRDEGGLTLSDMLLARTVMKP